MDVTEGGATDWTELDELPFVDEHTIKIGASREAVWTALQRYVATSLRVGGDGGLLTRILGTKPPAGFGVSESRPTDHLALIGRHRFSRYLLAFDLVDAGDGITLLGAGTYAVFPGVHGWVYRTLVIGTRAHVLATRHMLRSIKRLTTSSTEG